jgi:hypothetical protein
MVTDMARNIRKVLLSNITDLTQRAVAGSVTVLGTPLFIVGYLTASVGIPAQTVNAEIVEAVATSSSPTIMLCDRLAVNDGERSTETTTRARMPIGLSQDRWTYAQVGLRCANQVR